ncbi:MAG TPA: hypothetical protein VE954_00335 [Oligoflexus sp.]|uniref:hypothetical protein n=1 Tax=Oligoflexus sp. TaxID=1971216 RepID=UPI002D6BB6EC|nr:hypothetical protein [Oligoflexus sp.]HYX31525.1 hypothetical protein [Oligoflexus sp.]
MSKYFALSNLMTLILGLFLNGCGWLQEVKYKSGLVSFRITDVTLDPDNGEVTLSWSKASDVRMYRVWISRNSSCSDSSNMVAVERRSHTFKAMGPGTFFACVEAVPKYKSMSINTLSPITQTWKGQVTLRKIRVV